MNTQGIGVGRVLVMSAFALSCFGLLLFLWVAFGGAIPLKPKGYRVQVPVQEAIQLSSQADVRISGVPVGKVVQLDRGQDETIATLQIEERFAPLPSDVKAILRQKTLLGETFVELTPGSRSARKLPEGGRLPASRVAPTVELDEILKTFDGRTRERLQVFLRSWAKTLDGRGQDLNDVFGSLPAFVEDTSGLAGTLDREERSITRLIRETGTVFSVLGERDASIATIADAGERVLGTTARQERDLRATVRAAPPALAELRATLAAAQRASRTVRPLVRELGPTASLLPGLATDAQAFGPELTALTRGLEPVLRSSRTGLPAATRLVRALGPLNDRLLPVAQDLTPITRFLSQYPKELTVSWAKVAAATQAGVPDPTARGGIRRYLRLLPPVWNENVAVPEQREPTNRANPYILPERIDDLEAFTCRNLGNRQTIPPLLGAPPRCAKQGPLRFEGVERDFPRLARDADAGKATARTAP